MIVTLSNIILLTLMMIRKAFIIFIKDQRSDPRVFKPTIS